MQTLFSLENTKNLDFIFVGKYKEFKLYFSWKSLRYNVNFVSFQNTRSVCLADKYKALLSFSLPTHCNQNYQNSPAIYLSPELSTFTNSVISLRKEHEIKKGKEKKGWFWAPSPLHVNEPEQSLIWNIKIKKIKLNQNLSTIINKLDLVGSAKTTHETRLQDNWRSIISIMVRHQ